MIYIPITKQASSTYWEITINGKTLMEAMEDAWRNPKLQRYYYRDGVCYPIKASITRSRARHCKFDEGLIAEEQTN